MKPRCHRPKHDSAKSYLCALLALGTVALHAQSAAKKPNPASKVYFADVKGEAQIDTGDKIEELAQRSVYSAQGMVIETKRAENEQELAKSSSTMVYSNGTGAYFDSDTRVEIKRFVQEPFVPNRGDGDLEPSVSQTQAYVSRGTVGLCTSKLVAGSSMNYQTSHGSINIRGRKVVIEASSNATKISMLEGDSTVKAGAADLGGRTLKAGQQAIIRSGIGGQPNSIEIAPIPPQEAQVLDQKVGLACAAKKTVYFEVRELPNDLAAAAAAADPAADGAAPADPTAPTDSAAGAAAGDTAGAPAITAFNGDSAVQSTFTSRAVAVREIVPVPAIPVTLPVQYTVSPAVLPAQSGNTPGG